MTVVKRRCLKCQLFFNSPGAHVRMCDPCREEANREQAAVEDVGGHNRLENHYKNEKREDK